MIDAAGLLRRSASADNDGMDNQFSDRLDIQLMQHGAVTLYHQMEVLDADLAWLRGNSFQVEAIDCRELVDFERRMSVVLKFKQQFGYDDWTGNLDALNDAFYGLDTDEKYGLALCFLRYDLLKAQKPSFAEGVLDIIELNSRDYLLNGRRLLALVQSDDPRIQFGPLGARHARWNRREWFDKSRGL